MAEAKLIKNAPPLLYTPKDIALTYGLCHSTVLKEIHEGRLKASHKRGQTKRWFITAEDLKDWASGGCLEK